MFVELVGRVDRKKMYSKSRVTIVVKQSDRNLYLGNRRTRKQVFFDEIERIVPWQYDVALFNRRAYVFTVKTYATSVRYLSSGYAAGPTEHRITDAIHHSQLCSGERRMHPLTL